MKKLAIFLALVMLLGSFAVSAAPAQMDVETAVYAPISAEVGTVCLTVAVKEATTAGTVTVSYDNAALTYVSCDAQADLTSVNDTGSAVKLIYSNLEAREDLFVEVIFQYDCTRSATTVVEVAAQLNGEDDEIGQLSQSLTVELVTEEDICPSKVFTDLNQSLWYHEAVDYVVSNGLMNGMTPTLFAPNATSTRAQVVTVLSRMAGVDVSEYQGTSDFDDVDEADWFAPYVAWAVEQELVEGDGNGNFRPNSPISRQELVTILARFAGVTEADPSVLEDFTDAEQVADWAETAMSWAVENGIIQGYAGVLEPAGNATRAQIAQIVMNFDN